jgi:hypothetical protein
LKSKKNSPKEKVKNISKAKEKVREENKYSKEGNYLFGKPTENMNLNS